MLLLHVKASDENTDPKVSWYHFFGRAILCEDTVSRDIQSAMSVGSCLKYCKLLPPHTHLGLWIKGLWFLVFDGVCLCLHPIVSIVVIDFRFCLLGILTVKSPVKPWMCKEFHYQFGNPLRPDHRLGPNWEVFMAQVVIDCEFLFHGFAKKSITFDNYKNLNGFQGWSFDFHFGF